MFKARVKYRSLLNKCQDCRPIQVNLTNPTVTDQLSDPRCDVVTDFRILRALIALANALQYAHSRQAAKERVQLLGFHFLLSTLKVGNKVEDYSDFHVKARDMNITTGLYMRLGEDKESYQFFISLILLWRKNLGYGSASEQFSSSGMSPLTDIEFFLGIPKCYYRMEIIEMSVALIKFKVLQDLKMLRIVKETVGREVPQEILDMVIAYSTNSDLTSDLVKPLKSQEEYEEAIKTLTSQIDTLFLRAGISYWRSLFSLEQLPGRGCPFDHLDRALIRECLYGAFVETPGAERYFRDLLDTNSLVPPR